MSCTNYRANTRALSVCRHVYMSLLSAKLRHMQVLVRVCKLCGRDFRLSYSHGRPREHCWKCVPQGFKIAKSPNVRRVDNVFGHGSAEWAEGKLTWRGQVNVSSSRTARCV